MAAAQSFTFYDAKQQRAGMRMYTNAATNALETSDMAAISTDLGALSNTSLVAGTSVRSNGPATSNAAPVTPGSTSNYQDVADKAVFVFQDTSGALHKYQVPCPKSTIFLADQETIDFTNAAVKQFVADMTATTFSGTAATTSAATTSRNAVALVASVGGYRRRGKSPRKFNIYTRNSILTGGGGAP